MPVTVTEDNTAAFYKALAALTGSEVLIGIPAEGAERQADDGDPEPLTNAEIGLIMESGAPEANIPARPTLIPGVEGIRDAAAARLKKTAQAALAGDLAQVDRGLHTVGLLGQNAVRGRVAEGPPPPLSLRTLARRRARGRTGEKPLNDTGQFLRSVTYVVRTKGSR